MGPNFKCPISIICLVLSTITKIIEIGVQKQFALEFMNNMADCVEEYLSSENLTDAEIKEISLDELKRLIRLMAQLKANSTGQDKFKIIELYELEIAKRFLMCPFFPKRIKGMKEFGLIHDKVANRLQRTP